MEHNGFRKEAMMDITVKCNKKDHFNCSMYFMKRYFGLREIILMALLLIAGVLLYVFSDTIIILVFFGITVFVLLLTIVLFVWTSLAGCKHDLVKQGIAWQKIHFGQNEMTVVYLDAGGEQLFTEKHEYSKIEAVVIKKNFIYIYAGVAIFFYIKKSETEGEEFLALCNHLRTFVPAEKFKFKTVKRIYPKKKKITLDPKDGQGKK